MTRNANQVGSSHSSTTPVTTPPTATFARFDIVSASSCACAALSILSTVVVRGSFHELAERGPDVVHVA